MSEALRAVPSIDKLLRHPAGQQLAEEFARERVVEALRACCDELRQRLAAGQPQMVDSDALVAEARARLEDLTRPRLSRVINATGVVLHTNLGRAPLAPKARERVAQLAEGYSNLELDLSTGNRGSRYSHVVGLLRRLTGAEAAIVVNNCAASMMLIVDAVARGKEVIVSRGELIEIGGSFRVPEVLERGGARLVEVGCTNKTYAADFRRAVTPDTGLILSTHLSNFRMVGFTHAPSPHELVDLGREMGIPTCLDLGSGLLVRMGLEALAEEPLVSDMVRAGFDLVAFSGDKLLGGPQAGIIVGRSQLVARLAKNPMTRALRVDKLIISALEGTLQHYLDPEKAAREVPVLAMLGAAPEELQRAAKRLRRDLAELLGEAAQLEVVPGFSSVGGGSVPGRDLPTWLVRIVPTQASEEVWATRLRSGRPPVLVRRSEGALLLDPRTLGSSDREPLRQAFAGLIA